MLYRNGYARQHIDSEGVQTETFDEIDPTDFMKDTGKEIQLELDGTILYSKFGNIG